MPACYTYQERPAGENKAYIAQSVPHHTKHTDSGLWGVFDRRMYRETMLISRRCLVPVLLAADLLLQGCQLTQYTEGYTLTLLNFARKVL